MDICRAREPALVELRRGVGVACFLHHSKEAA
jgi:hypothetical protein